MKKKLVTGMGIIIVALGVASFFYPSFFSDAEVISPPAESAHTTNQEQPAREIDYYTCGMHPSVRATEPGKCPLCGMTLVPVYKKGAATSESVDLTFSVSPAQRQLIGVKYATASVTSLTKTIHAVGKVEFDERMLSEVNLKISGWIEKLYVDYTGKTVQKGEPLFSLYSPELVSAQEEYLLARTAAGKGVSEVAGEYSSPLSPSHVLERARQRLMLWGLAEEQIVELEQRGKPETSIDILSPQNGVVVEKMAVAGSRVEEGMPLYNIADLSTVWIHAEVYEYELSSVQVGQDATVRINSFPGEVFSGRITYIFPFLDAGTRSVKVRMEFLNTNGKLKPKMYADVEINTTRKKVLTIPEHAVLYTGQRQIVFVDKGDGLFEARLVTVGERGDNLVEILNGLQSGERVVTDANFLIDAESRIQGVLQRLEGAEPAPLEHKH